MGFSHTKAAGDTLKKISALNGFSNSILHPKKKKVIGYFEVDREDKAGGGLTGNVYKFVGLNHSNATYVGQFQIDGRGKIKTFPLIDIDAVNKTVVGPRELAKATPL